MRMKAIILLTALLISTGSFAQTIWVLDKPHTNIRFVVTHMIIAQVEGEFREFDGRVASTSDDFQGSTVEFRANTASINTNNERRDGHLKSPDFFDVVNYPEILFKGTLVKEDGAYLLAGDLTIRGVTKNVKLPVRYLGMINTQNGRKAGFKISGSINRFDYGVSWNSRLDTGGLIVGEEVQISINVELNEVVPSPK